MTEREQPDLGGYHIPTGETITVSGYEPFTIKTELYIQVINALLSRGSLGGRYSQVVAEQFGLQPEEVMQIGQHEVKRRTAIDLSRNRENKAE